MLYKIPLERSRKVKLPLTKIRKSKMMKKQKLISSFKEDILGNEG